MGRDYPGPRAGRIRSRHAQYDYPYWQHNDRNTIYPRRLKAPNGPNRSRDTASPSPSCVSTARSDWTYQPTLPPRTPSPGNTPYRRHRRDPVMDSPRNSPSSNAYWSSSSPTCSPLVPSPTQTLSKSPRVVISRWSDSQLRDFESRLDQPDHSILPLESDDRVRGAFRGNPAGYEDFEDIIYFVNDDYATSLSGIATPDSSRSRDADGYFSRLSETLHIDSSTCADLCRECGRPLDMVRGLPTPEASSPTRESNERTTAAAQKQSATDAMMNHSRVNLPATDHAQDRAARSTSKKYRDDGLDCACCNRMTFDRELQAIDASTLDPGLAHAYWKLKSRRDRRLIMHQHARRLFWPPGVRLCRCEIALAWAQLALAPKPNRRNLHALFPYAFTPEGRPYKEYEGVCKLGQEAQRVLLERLEARGPCGTSCTRGNL
ncbi:hypothetical protein K461DRAFT_264050 [Myriangium duriaei CBS 260.36]|uniref:Uncharacterized protein n=1 Tax=Myriangium duriaei CBS 260.36 TaxID=1168546 RepID=A0A9P4ML85_9PEZI|nr:hypothetical protein K461DRAFT_264050 [Myriangium duriaei CBS 260.36]